MELGSANLKNMPRSSAVLSSVRRRGEAPDSRTCPLAVEGPARTQDVSGRTMRKSRRPSPWQQLDSSGLSCLCRGRWCGRSSLRWLWLEPPFDRLPRFSPRSKEALSLFFFADLVLHACSQGVSVGSLGALGTCTFQLGHHACLYRPCFFFLAGRGYTVR